MNETLRANEEVRVRKETEGFSTTFFMDFSIADRFGDDAIKEVVDKDYDDVALTKEDIEKSYGVSGAEGTAGSVKNIAKKAHGANVENQKADPKTAPRGLDTAEGIETNHKQ